jgi:tetratricopeptide (TPR) repeat protein
MLMNRRERRAAAKKGKLELSARANEDVAVVFGGVTGEMSAGANGNANDTSKRSTASFYDAGVRHFQSGRHGAAEECCRQALAVDPGHANSLHLLGLIHAATGRLDVAVEQIAAAIRSDPRNPDFFSDLGSLLQRMGRLEEATKSYDLAIQLKPHNVDAWTRLGDLLQTQMRSEEALLTYDHAAKLDPSNGLAMYKAGQLLFESGRYEDALARFDLLQTTTPGRAEVLRERAVCLNRLNRREEAAASYQKAIEIAPRNYDYHNDLGSILLGLRRFEQALAHFREAIEIKPDFVAAMNNLGIALVDLKRPEEALPVFDRGLSISPELAQLFSNKANALKALGRYDEALAAYDRAIALKPDYVKAHCNRGACLDQMLRTDEALSSLKDALALQPDYPEARWNLGLNRLRVGDFKTGWIESEWRWKCPGLRLGERKMHRPLWLGAEPIDGKVLLLHSDQGLGDALQFCRYAPLAAARGAKVIVEVQRSLRDLLCRLAGVSMVISKGEALPDFDFHCPLCSLPLAFDTTIDTIPSAAPYLSVDGRGERWEGRLRSSGLPKIGLVWSGNPEHLNDQNRSVALKNLLPLLEVKAQFVSLQKDVRPDDLAVLRDRHDILDFGPELGSFSDTAALLAQLDLLISVDTSVAHLAGALGRPVWILLPYAPDWRWLLDRADSPWYPTASLFRQSKTREWGSVVRQVGEALQQFVEARSSVRPITTHFAI